MDFLIPSLNLAYDFTLLENNDESLNIISKIIDISRFYSKPSNDEIKLVDEIKVIDKYFSIQEARYNKCFKYEILNNTNMLTYVNRKKYLPEVIKFFLDRTEDIRRAKNVSVIFQIKNEAPVMEIVIS